MLRNILSKAAKLKHPIKVLGVIKNIFYFRKKRIKNKILNFRRDIYFKIKLSRFVRKHSIKASARSIIIWEAGGCDCTFTKNAIISKALNVRGFKTLFVLCDGIALACACRDIKENIPIKNWPTRCKDCLNYMLKIARKYDIEIVMLSSIISGTQKDELYNFAMHGDIYTLKKFKFHGVCVADIAWSSLVRYMQGLLVNFDGMSKDDEVVFRLYFFSALIHINAAFSIIKKYNPSAFLTSHGSYADYASAFILADKLGIPSTAWTSGYEKFKHYFFMPANVDRGLSEDTWNIIKNRILTDKQILLLNDFIKHRYQGKKASDIYVSADVENSKSLKSMLKIENNNPIVMLFAHINWDAILDEKNMIFASANDWVLESIKRMLSIKNVNWIIRVHPAELVYKSALTTDELIAKNFCVLQDHVKIINSNTSINSYGLYELLDVAITICGTVGIEVSLLGKSVIVCGNAHYSNKGFTIDVKSREEYFYTLENIHNIKALKNEQIELARRYAYSYFIERHVPLNIIDRAQGHWGDIDLSRLDELLPGKDMALDKLCEAIVLGKDVIIDQHI